MSSYKVIRFLTFNLSFHEKNWKWNKWKNKIMLYFLFKFSFLNSTATIMTLSGCDKCSCWIWIVHLTNTAECSIMLCFGLVYSCRKWKAEVAAQLCSWWSAWWCFPASAARSMGSHWQMYVFNINGFTETVAVLSFVCKQLVKFSDLVTWVLICCFRVLCCLSHLEHSALWCASPKTVPEIILGLLHCAVVCICECPAWNLGLPSDVSPHCCAYIIST